MDVLTNLFNAGGVTFEDYSTCSPLGRFNIDSYVRLHYPVTFALALSQYEVLRKIRMFFVRHDIPASLSSSVANDDNSMYASQVDKSSADERAFTYGYMSEYHGNAAIPTSLDSGTKICSGNTLRILRAGTYLLVAAGESASQDFSGMNVNVYESGSNITFVEVFHNASTLTFVTVGILEVLADSVYVHIDYDAPISATNTTSLWIAPYCVNTHWE